MQDYRTLKLNDEENKDVVVSPEEHFKRLHVDQDLIQAMITQMHYLKTDLLDLTGNPTLYSFYLQIQIELIVGTLLPTSKYEKINSILDLFQMPNWLENIAQAALILANLESPKNQLSNEIERTIFENTQIADQWERVIIVSKLPHDFTRDQIKRKLYSIVQFI